MKKLVSLAAMLAIGLFTVSCSDADDEGRGANAKGESYMSLAIQLPTSVSTRAANDNFQNGKPEEYAVKDATLILFKGTSPTAAKYISNYPLNLNWGTAGSGNITSRAEIVQAISNSDKPTADTDYLYAYVVLNKTQSALATILSGADGKTFDALFGSTATMSEDIDISQGLVMTNAPLANAPGGTAAPTSEEVTVLSPVDKDKIFETEAQAKGKIAATIYVERNVAKVTVDGTAANIDGTTIPCTINGWILDNTNPTTYFQRNISETDNAYGDWYNLRSDATTSSDPYRFVGSNTALTNLYRIYWGNSTNYGGSATLTSVGTTPTFEATGSDKPQYCYENTFDVTQQKEKNTTRAIIEMKINGGYDFYTINEEYYGKADGNDEKVKQRIIDLLVGNPTVIAAMATVNSAFTTATVEKSDIQLDTTTPDKVKLKDESKLSDGTNTIQLNTTELQAVIDNMFNSTASTNTIKYYAGGHAYYKVLIKHFGDDLTPWSAASHLSTHNPYCDGTEATESKANYLGRYGVLRNNWYNINITKVTGFGSPTVPSTPGSEWDDDVKSFLTVEINILAWAYRNQDETL